MTADQLGMHARHQTQLTVVWLSTPDITRPYPSCIHKRGTTRTPFTTFTEGGTMPTRFTPAPDALERLEATPRTPIKDADPFAQELVDALAGWFTCEQTAYILGCSTRSLQKFGHLIAHTRLGSQKRYAKTALRDFIIARRAAA